MKSLLLIVLPALVLGWWDVGHMLTAAIAEIKLNQLDPYASVHFRDLVASINQLVDNRSRTFIESACWADDIKSYPYYMKLFDAYHFKDTPYVYDTVVPVINYTENALSSLQVMAVAHKTLTQNTDRNSAERALFARYVVHLVGDIHQPLHSVALFNLTYPKGDIGGNAEKVILTNGSTSNFHSYWDAGAYLLQNDSWTINRPMNIQNLTALKDVANSMIKQYGNEVETLGKIIDPAVWAQESFRIAQNTTYPHILTTNKLDDQYNAQTYETAKKRITLAGYRLAYYVVDLYKHSKGRSQQNLLLSSLPSFNPKPWAFIERSIPELRKLLAEDSRNAFKESPLSFLKGLDTLSQ
jgi:hypothetical protein